VGPLSAKAGEDVLVLGQLHLEAALTGAGVLGENVEDQGGAVEDLDVELAFEVALLRRAQLVVEDDGGVIRGSALGDYLLELALADIGRRVEGLEALGGAADDVGAGGLGEELKLFEGGVGVPAAPAWAAVAAAVAVLELGSNEERALARCFGAVQLASGYG
jgi:hypothetical protein